MNDFIAEFRRMHWAQAQPIERETIRHLEAADLDAWFTNDVACEGRYHAGGDYGHNPEQPASFLVRFPCGARKKMCAGWVRASINYAAVLCFACDETVNPEHLIAVPI